MKLAYKLIFIGALGAAMTWPARAEDKTEFKDDREKASYGVGMFFGNQVKRSSMDIDLDVAIAAMKDVLAGKETRLNDQAAQMAIRTYQQASQAKLADKNKAEGDKFLAENKTKPGIQTKTITLPDGRSGEMQYKVITEGSGAIPKSNDTVNVNYVGTLINGKEFDSSAKHGPNPSKLMANRVIPGWSQALQMMKTGSKWELYLPSTLGYGDQGTPAIEPGSTLIFTVELVSIDEPTPPPAPPQPAQPLTSDIIKVPSAEELKKGAKIEVIKAEDVPKLIAQQATNNPASTNAPEKK
jgi:FKBP-type peptidyl-prolyl cis-trans isomerase